MSAFDDNPYSTQFAHLAARLEQYLRKNGVSCDDADRIIEESSILYFGRLGPSNKISKFLKKDDPRGVFIDSARRAIAARLPEAIDTFGSKSEIARAVH
jgi:hypothetical protein